MEKKADVQRTNNMIEKIDKGYRSLFSNTVKNMSNLHDLIFKPRLLSI